MESFNFHKGKLEKANKIKKHRQLRKIANLLRYAEMCVHCVVLVLISRLSLQQLPLALKYSSEYLRGFTISPRLVFLVGNIIIITLFAQSGYFSPHDSSARNGSDSDLYLEFLQNSTVYQKIQGADQKRLSIRAENSIKKGHRIDGCMIKKDEKQSTKADNRMKLAEKQSTKADDNRMKLEEKKSTETKRGSEVKDYRRCQSENMTVRDVQSGEEPRRRVLQRCESESEKSIVMRRSAFSCSYPEDGMSNDEFRRTVEAFIARQQRLRTHELQNLYSQSKP